MQLDIRYKEVKVRRPNSHLFKGKDKFTGSVTFSVVGTINHEPVRLSLGAEDKNVAIRRINKVEKAIADGPTSLLWAELKDSLPPKTFTFFAERIGFVANPQSKATKTTWQDLCDIFEIEMQRLVDNKARGVSSEEGTMAESTRDRYRQTLRHFTALLQDPQTALDKIDSGVVAKFKADRYKRITQLKQSRGGGSVALDVAVLHRVFAFAVAQKIMASQPIDLSRESKPGKNPKNGARPFTGQELQQLRNSARKDLFIFFVLRWTGLRVSDAVRLRWSNIHFDRGTNGEVEILTQKRTKIAIIPLSTELRNVLEELHRKRKPRHDDQVLLNPATGEAFASRVTLSRYVKGLCRRAGVKGGTAHCFRDTFACDMLARGAGVFEVAKMLADTVDTVEKHYAQFVPAARDAVQAKMDTGIGIEEQAKFAQQRSRKVVGIRG